MHWATYQAYVDEYEQAQGAWATGITKRWNLGGLR